MTTRHVRVAIIGAGFSGLGMAAQLTRHGIRDFLVVERAHEVGGTWRDNTYPGAACDIRSDLYSFSFAPNPGWTHRYGRQREILEYLKGVADRYELRPRILFGAELRAADWDDEAALWRVTTSIETFTADLLVSGNGPLIDPKWPALAGIETFAGPRFHSACWRHDAYLAGKRIAVIGTGASAIQFVPELQKIAGRLTVFQRTPPWIIPRADGLTSDRRKRWFARVPAAQRLARAAIFASAEVRFAGFRFKPIGRVFETVSRRFLRSQVKDPVLRAKLTPDYRIGCKRILISSDYYAALTKPCVELVTDAIASIEGHEIVTADGTRRRFDVLIGGTGFEATHPSIASLLRGRDGVSLADRWSGQGSGHMSALRGTTVHGFPNLFLLVGPNTALGHNSMIYMIEAQLGYVLQALQFMDATGTRVIEPRAAAQAAYNERIQHELRDSVWTTGGCRSYYLDDGGRNTTLWPRRAGAFRATVRRFDPAEYVLSGAAAAPAPVPSALS
ncbi:MAG TPA: NAD(P)/FAD-dependent oxidoreductase [Pseudolysinimonas sp.]|nr:NAD(P)/FAD-dependent oxidoreductase [Pseudolysinimonas sp.]